MIEVFVHFCLLLVPVGVMTFIRHTIPPDKCPQWDKCDKFVGGTPFHVDSEGTIEDAAGLIQVDFANKLVFFLYSCNCSFVV